METLNTPMLFQTLFGFNNFFSFFFLDFFFYTIRCHQIQQHNVWRYSWHKSDFFVMFLILKDEIKFHSAKEGKQKCMCFHWKNIRFSSSISSYHIRYVFVWDTEVSTREHVNHIMFINKIFGRKKKICKYLRKGLSH